MQTESSRPAALASCLRRIAALSPAGPAPAITTSYCMHSRSLIGPSPAIRSAPRRGGSTIRLTRPANSLTIPSMAGRSRCVGGDAADLTLAEARSALAWWLEAGVDVAVQEEPRDWLKPASPKAQPVESAGGANGVEPSHETLAELQQWLASSAQLPLASATARRILPHGPEDAAVILLSDAPSLEDLGAGQPIGGPAWELTKRMLAAIGIAPEEAYSASLSCFNSP